eukprot:UN32097
MEHPRHKKRLNKPDNTFREHRPAPNSLVQLPPDLAPCEAILKTIAKMENAWVFEERVDPDKYPDYYNAITRPMCLNDVRKNLANGVYHTIEQIY